MRVTCPTCEATAEVATPGLHRCQVCGEELPRLPAAGGAPPETAGPPTEPGSQAPPDADLPHDVAIRVAELENGIRERPSARALYLSLAQVLTDAGRRDRAADALRRGLEADPGNVTMKARLALLERPADAPPMMRVSAPDVSPPSPRDPSPLRRAGLPIAGAMVALLLAGLAWRIAFPATRCLVAEAHAVSAPRFSPDGARVAFLASRAEGQELCVVGLHDGEVRSVARVSGWGDASFAWSPDGLRLAFVSSDRTLQGSDDDLDATDEASFDPSAWEEGVYVVDADGGDAVWVAEGTDPAWAPDGMSILLTSWGGDDPDPEGRGPSLHVANVVTGGTSRVTTQHARRYSFSPDGRRIVFEAAAEMEGDWDPGAEDLTTLAEGALAADPTTAAGASSGLQREMEARAYDQGGGAISLGVMLGPADIFLGSPGGATPVAVTRDRKSEGPRFTPAGDAVVFVRERAGRVEIARAPVGGAGPEPLSSGSVEPFDPESVRVLPDGETLLFVGLVKEANVAVATTLTGSMPADLYLARPGKDARRLENRHPFKQRFDVSPDGRQIVYVAPGQGESGGELWLMRL